VGDGGSPAHPLPHATWRDACRFLSDAISQNGVVPTAQHVNLLLSALLHDRQWEQMDLVEDLYAFVYHSVQELQADRQAAPHRIPGRAHSWRVDDHIPSSSPPSSQEYVVHHDASPAAAAVPAPSPTLDDTRRRTNLRRLEALLRPNAQTFDLLMQAALRRGSWATCLERFQDCCDNGVSINDARIQVALQAYSLGGARTVIQRAGSDVAANATLPRSSHQTHLQKSTQLWESAYALVTSCQHLISDARTVGLIMELLAQAGESHYILQLYRDFTARQPLRLPSGLGGDVDRITARISEIVVVAAREVGDWPVALAVHEAAVTAFPVIDEMSALFTSTADAMGADAVTQPPTTTGGSAFQWTAGHHQRLIQLLLLNALHTLRRVRRYADIITIYDGAVAASTLQSTCTAIGYLGWTTDALVPVAQAALATRNLPVLLQMIEGAHVGGSGLFWRDDCPIDAPTAHRRPLDAPLEAYDAALRLLHAAAMARRVPPPRTGGATGDRLADSRQIVGRFLRRALKELEEWDALRRPQGPLLTTVHLPLLRLCQQAVSDGRTTRETLHQAVDAFLAVRRPDTLVIALAMQVLSRCDPQDGEPAGQAVRRCLQVVMEDAGQKNDPAVSVFAVVTAVEALTALHQPFAALNVLSLAAASLRCLPRPTNDRLHLAIYTAAVAQARRDAAACGRAGHSVSKLPVPDDVDETTAALVTLSKNCRFSAEDLGAPHPTPCGTCRPPPPLPTLQAVVQSTVALMDQLQSHSAPPTEEAVQRLLEALQCLQPTPTAARVEEDGAVPTIVNALLHEIGGRPIQRAALWPQCLQLLHHLQSPLGPPATTARRCAANVAACTPLPRAGVRTLQVLCRFLCWCERAEASFVERLVTEWLLPHAVHRVCASGPPVLGAWLHLAKTPRQLCRVYF